MDNTTADEVLDVVTDALGPLTLPEILALIVTRHGHLYVTGAALELARELDFPVREIVERLINDGKLEFTPRRLVRVKR